MDLDAYDRKILRVLKTDAKISNLKLSEAIGLSPTACLRRVQKLEKEEIIAGYHASINPDKIGNHTRVYVIIGLDNHSKKTMQNLESILSSYDEVTELSVVSGTFEYIAKIEVPSIKEYKNFHTNVIAQISGVNTISTSFILDKIK